MSDKVSKKKLREVFKAYHIVEMDTVITYDEQVNITLTCVKKKKADRQIIEIDGQSYELRKIKTK